MPTRRLTFASRRLLTAIAALAAIFGIALAGQGGGSGAGGPEIAGACGVVPVSLKVKTTYPQAYARQYRKEVPVELTNRGGYKIGGLVVQVYTFGGLRLGSSPALGSLRPGQTRVAKVRLGVPMQAGKVTFVVKGANEGCNLAEINHVVAFHVCQTELPVTFPNKPEGYASDYSDFLSVGVEAKEGQPIFRPRSRVYSFNGALIGQDVNQHRVIYGLARFDNRLGKPLVSGGYTMIVRGFLNQPRSCGPKTAQVDLDFK